MDCFEFFEIVKWKTLTEAETLFEDRDDADALEAQAFLSLCDNLYTSGNELIVSLGGYALTQAEELLRRAADVRGEPLSELGREAIKYSMYDTIFCGGSLLRFYQNRCVRILFSTVIIPQQEERLLTLAEEVCSRSFAASLCCIYGRLYNGELPSEAETLGDSFAPFVTRLRADTIKRNADDGDTCAAHRYALLLRERKDRLSGIIRIFNVFVAILTTIIVPVGIFCALELVEWFFPTEIEDDGSFTAKFFLAHPVPRTNLQDRIILLPVFLLILFILFFLISRISALLAQREALYHHYYALSGTDIEQAQYVIQPDTAKAEHYLNRAYELDEKCASIYAEYLHYTKRSDEAKKILTRAVERDDSNAMMMMRRLFLGPRAELLQKAADLENREAIVQLADSAEFTKKSIYYERAAELGHEYALCWLSEKLARGSLIYHVKKDPDKAFEYARRAAGSGSPDGLFQLGWCYEHGVGVPKQKEKAVQCYQDSLKTGGRYVSLAMFRMLHATAYGEKSSLDSAVVSTEKDSDIQKERLVYQGVIKGTIRPEQIKSVYAELAAVSATQREELRRNEAFFTEYCIQQEEATKCAAQRTSSDEYTQSEETLCRRFGDNWQRLCEDARICLVSARTMLHFTAKYEARGFDYSGVSITASSALEYELKRVFFTPLIQRFQEKYSNRYDWPKAFFKKKKRDSEDALTDFTLGTLPYILGVNNPESFSAEQKRIVTDFLTDIIREEVYEKSVYSALTKPLFLPGFHSEKSFLDITEEIRDKYRNPAAHTVRVNRESAQSCYQVVAGVEDDLTKVESALEVLLFLLKS